MFVRGFGFLAKYSQGNTSGCRDYLPGFYQKICLAVQVIYLGFSERKMNIPAIPRPLAGVQMTGTLCKSAKSEFSASSTDQHYELFIQIIKINFLSNFLVLP